MKTETQIERLEQLIRVMEGLSPHEKRKHFNMAEWGEKTDCGTTMCAAGFCASDPWFKRRGLKIAPYDERLYELHYRDYQNWDALHAFFGFGPPDNVWTSYSLEAAEIFVDPVSVKGVVAAAKRRIEELRT